MTLLSANQNAYIFRANDKAKYCMSMYTYGRTVRHFIDKLYCSMCSLSNYIKIKKNN